MTAIALAALTLAFARWAHAFIAATTVELPSGRFHTLFDDGMIAMRYAWMLAHGHGLVFNAGQRVEGFSNPLFVVAILTPAALVAGGKSAAVLVVQWAGALLLVGNAALTARVAATLVADESPAWRCVAAIAGFATALLYYPLDFWTLEGMETGLVALLATAALSLAARPQPRPTRFGPLFGVLVGLLVCTRLDTAPIAVLLWLFRALKLPPEERRQLRRETAIAVALVAVMMLARRFYFGAWLPNTYALKVQGMPIAIRWHNGRLFVAPFLSRQVGGALVVTLFGAAWQRSSLALTIGLSLCTATLYQAAVGGDPWTYWRQMAPYVPLVIVGSAWSALVVLRRVPWLGVLVAALVLYDGVVRSNAPFAAEAHFRELPYLVDENRKNVALAVALERIVTPSARLGLVSAGVIGYYSDNEIVDFLGKIDRHVAQLAPDLRFGFHGLSTVPGHNKYDLEYSIVQLRPDYVQVDSWGRQSVHAFVASHYQRVGKLWLLRDSPNIRWDLARPNR
ncbi:MAG TPA: hypothetical protein VIA18_14125 [Polyangia bacterium]|nr:hypothetical protein [Polyangia bacterium]